MQYCAVAATAEAELQLAMTAATASAARTRRGDSSRSGNVMIAIPMTISGSTPARDHIAAAFGLIARLRWGGTRPADRADRYLLPPSALLLLQRCIHGGVTSVESRSQSLHGGNDSETDAGGDQGVFDRGRTGFVVQKSRNQTQHRWLL